MHDGRARFDACSADTPEAAQRIVRAAVAAGLKEGQEACRQGLGVPSPRWAEAAELSITAVAELGGGSVTLSDANISLIAREGTPRLLFDQINSALKVNLPDLFSLSATLPVSRAEDARFKGLRFVAEITDTGDVQLRGSLGSALSQTTVAAFANANFVSKTVLDATDLQKDVPVGWPLRVMAGLEALAKLEGGNVIIQPDTLSVKGVTGDRDRMAQIPQILSNRLGDGAEYDLDVRYDKGLDPLAKLIKPSECLARIIALTDENKITFESSSTKLDAQSLDTIAKIAEILTLCPSAEIEISGHTDSQGREAMNLRLSEARAEEVLLALRRERARVKSLVAVGYGEIQPIADNSTEEGREANRRIEFRLTSSTAVELTVAPDGGGTGNE